MSDYTRLLHTLPSLRSATHLREVFDRIQRDEDRLIGVRDQRQRLLCESFLRLCRQTAVVQVLLAAEGNPGVRRELRPLLSTNYMRELPLLSPEELRPEVAEILRTLPLATPQAAYATASAQVLLCLGTMAYVWLFRTQSSVWLGVAMLAVLAGWLAIGLWRGRRARGRSKEVLEKLREHLTVRLQILRCLHPELESRY